MPKALPKLSAPSYRRPLGARPLVLGLLAALLIFARHARLSVRTPTVQSGRRPHRVAGFPPDYRSTPSQEDSGRGHVVATASFRSHLSSISGFIVYGRLG